MNETVPGSSSGGMIDRIKAILMTPKDEWSKIDSEPATVGGLMTGWVVPLAAIGPIATLIGSQLFGYGAFGISFQPSLMGSVSIAVTSYVLSLAGIIILSLIIDALAPSFGGTKNKVQAMKVAAYGATASFVGGIFGLLPALSILGIAAGLYSLYLLYLGLPRLMKTPEDKGVAYTAVTVVCAIVLWLVMGAVSRALLPAPGLTIGDRGGSITVPGVGTVETERLQKTATEMEERAKAMSDRSAKLQGATPVDPGQLQALLPASLGSMARTSVENERVNAGIMGVSTAKASYESGDDRLRLSITDMAGAGALAAAGSAMGVERSRQTETGYEKTGVVDGRMTMEEWNSTSRRVKYGVIYGDRFLVQAEGRAANIDAAKAAVAAIDASTLEGLAR